MPQWLSAIGGAIASGGHHLARGLGIEKEKKQPAPGGGDDATESQGGAPAGGSAPGAGSTGTAGVTSAAFDTKEQPEPGAKGSSVKPPGIPPNGFIAPKSNPTQRAKQANDFDSITPMERLRSQRMEPKQADSQNAPERKVESSRSLPVGQETFAEEQTAAVEAIPYAGVPLLLPPTETCSTRLGQRLLGTLCVFAWPVLLCMVLWHFFGRGTQTYHLDESIPVHINTLNCHVRFVQVASTDEAKVDVTSWRFNRKVLEGSEAFQEPHRQVIEAGVREDASSWLPCRVTVLHSHLRHLSVAADSKRQVDVSGRISARNLSLTASMGQVRMDELVAQSAALKIGQGALNVVLGPPPASAAGAAAQPESAEVTIESDSAPVAVRSSQPSLRLEIEERRSESAGGAQIVAGRIGQHITSEYELVARKVWCQEKSLEGFVYQRLEEFKACRRLCDVDPRCTIFIWAPISHWGGGFRCATFATCDKHKEYLAGEPRIYKLASRVRRFELSDSAQGGAREEDADMEVYTWLTAGVMAIHDFAAEFGNPKEGDAFTQEHLDLVQKSSLTALTFEDLAKQKFIKTREPKEIKDIVGLTVRPTVREASLYVQLGSSSGSVWRGEGGSDRLQLTDASRRQLSGAFKGKRGLFVLLLQPLGAGMPDGVYSFASSAILLSANVRLLSVLSLGTLQPSVARVPIVTRGLPRWQGNTSRERHETRKREVASMLLRELKELGAEEPGSLGLLTFEERASKQVSIFDHSLAGEVTERSHHWSFWDPCLFFCSLAAIGVCTVAVWLVYTVVWPELLDAHHTRLWQDHYTCRSLMDVGSQDGCLLVCCSQFPQPCVLMQFQRPRDAEGVEWVEVQYSIVAGVEDFKRTKNPKDELAQEARWKTRGELIPWDSIQGAERQQMLQLTHSVSGLKSGPDLVHFRLRMLDASKQSGVVDVTAPSRPVQLPPEPSASACLWALAREAMAQSGTSGAAGSPAAFALHCLLPTGGPPAPDGASRPGAACLPLCPADRPDEAAPVLIKPSDGQLCFWGQALEVEWQDSEQREVKLVELDSADYPEAVQVAATTTDVVGSTQAVEADNPEDVQVVAEAKHVDASTHSVEVRPAVLVGRGKKLWLLPKDAPAGIARCQLQVEGGAPVNIRVARPLLVAELQACYASFCLLQQLPMSEVLPQVEKTEDTLLVIDDERFAYPFERRAEEQSATVSLKKKGAVRIALLEEEEMGEQKSVPFVTSHVLSDAGCRLIPELQGFVALEETWHSDSSSVSSFLACCLAWLVDFSSLATAPLLALAAVLWYDRVSVELSTEAFPGSLAEAFQEVGLASVALPAVDPWAKVLVVAFLLSTLGTSGICAAQPFCPEGSGSIGLAVLAVGSVLISVLACMALLLVVLSGLIDPQSGSALPTMCATLVASAAATWRQLLEVKRSAEEHFDGLAGDLLERAARKASKQLNEQAAPDQPPGGVQALGVDLEKIETTLHSRMRQRMLRFFIEFLASRPPTKVAACLSEWSRHDQVSSRARIALDRGTKELQQAIAGRGYLLDPVEARLQTASEEVAKDCTDCDNFAKDLLSDAQKVFENSVSDMSEWLLKPLTDCHSGDLPEQLPLNAAAYLITALGPHDLAVRILWLEGTSKKTEKRKGSKEAQARVAKVDDPISDGKAAPQKSEETEAGPGASGPAAQVARGRSGDGADKTKSKDKGVTVDKQVDAQLVSQHGKWLERIQEVGSAFKEKYNGMADDNDVEGLDKDLAKMLCSYVRTCLYCDDATLKEWGAADSFSELLKDSIYRELPRLCRDVRLKRMRENASAEAALTVCIVRLVQHLLCPSQAPGVFAPLACQLICPPGPEYMEKRCQLLKRLSRTWRRAFCENKEVVNAMKFCFEDGVAHEFFGSLFAAHLAKESNLRQPNRSENRQTKRLRAEAPLQRTGRELSVSQDVKHRGFITLEGAKAIFTRLFTPADRKVTLDDALLACGLRSAFADWHGKNNKRIKDLKKEDTCVREAMTGIDDPCGTLAWLDERLTVLEGALQQAAEGGAAAKAPEVPKAGQAAAPPTLQASAYGAPANTASATAPGKAAPQQPKAQAPVGGAPAQTPGAPALEMAAPPQPKAQASAADKAKELLQTLRALRHTKRLLVLLSRISGQGGAFCLNTLFEALEKRTAADGDIVEDSGDKEFLRSDDAARCLTKLLWGSTSVVSEISGKLAETGCLGIPDFAELKQSAMKVESCANTETGAQEVQLHFTVGVEQQGKYISPHFVTELLKDNWFRATVPVEIRKMRAYEEKVKEKYPFEPTNYEFIWSSKTPKEKVPGEADPEAVQVVGKPKVAAEKPRKAGSKLSAPTTTSVAASTEIEPNVQVAKIFNDPTFRKDKRFVKFAAEYMDGRQIRVHLAVERKLTDDQMTQFRNKGFEKHGNENVASVVAVTAKGELRPKLVQLVPFDRLCLIDAARRCIQDGSAKVCMSPVVLTRKDKCWVVPFSSPPVGLHTPSSLAPFPDQACVQLDNDLLRAMNFEWAEKPDGTGEPCKFDESKTWRWGGESNEEGFSFHLRFTGAARVIAAKDAKAKLFLEKDEQRKTGRIMFGGTEVHPSFPWEEEKDEVIISMSWTKARSRELHIWVDYRHTCKLDEKLGSAISQLQFVFDLCRHPLPHATLCCPVPNDATFLVSAGLCSLHPKPPPPLEGKNGSASQEPALSGALTAVLLDGYKVSAQVAGLAAKECAYLRVWQWTPQAEVRVNFTHRRPAGVPLWDAVQGTRGKSFCAESAETMPKTTVAGASLFWTDVDRLKDLASRDAFRKFSVWESLVTRATERALETDKHAQGNVAKNHPVALVFKSKKDVKIKVNELQYEPAMNRTSEENPLAFLLWPFSDVSAVRNRQGLTAESEDSHLDFTLALPKCTQEEGVAIMQHLITVSKALAQGRLERRWLLAKALLQFVVALPVTWTQEQGLSPEEREKWEKLSPEERKKREELSLEERKKREQEEWCRFGWVKSQFRQPCLPSEYLMEQLYKRMFPKLNVRTVVFNQTLGSLDSKLDKAPLSTLSEACALTRLHLQSDKVALSKDVLSDLLADYLGPLPAKAVDAIYERLSEGVSKLEALEGALWEEFTTYPWAVPSLSLKEGGGLEKVRCVEKNGRVILEIADPEDEEHEDVLAKLTARGDCILESVRAESRDGILFTLDLKKETGKTLDPPGSGHWGEEQLCRDDLVRWLKKCLDDKGQEVPELVRTMRISLEGRMEQCTKLSAELFRDLLDASGIDVDRRVLRKVFDLDLAERESDDPVAEAVDRIITIPEGAAPKGWTHNGLLTYPEGVEGAVRCMHVLRTDFGRFQGMMQSLGISLPEAQLRAAFAAMDTQGIGYVSARDFVQGMPALQACLRHSVLRQLKLTIPQILPGVFGGAVTLVLVFLFLYLGVSLVSVRDNPFAGAVESLLAAGSGVAVFFHKLPQGGAGSRLMRSVRHRAHRLLDLEEEELKEVQVDGPSDSQTLPLLPNAAAAPQQESG